jgi:hypothetical protein
MHLVPVTSVSKIYSSPNLIMNIISIRYYRSWIIRFLSILKRFVTYIMISLPILVPCHVHIFSFISILATKKRELCSRTFYDLNKTRYKMH